MDRVLLRTGLVLLPLIVGVSRGTAATCAAPGTVASLEAGRWFSEHNQAACAADAYRAALKADPRSHAALDGLAKSLTATGDTNSAIALLRTSSHDEELTLDLAAAYTKAGRLDEAYQTLTRALKANPASARIAGALVVVLANHGQLDDSYRLAENFAAQHPRDAEAQKVYLRVLVATNDSTTARPLVRRLLAATPRDSELLYLSGVLERKAGEFPAARGHLEKAISMTPNFADSHYNLGIVLARLQDNAGAVTELTRAIDLGVTDPEAHLELSKALRSQGNTQQADEQLKLYQQSLKANADHEIAASKTSDADQAMAKGDALQAAGLYREALELTPQDASLDYKLAMALQKTGDNAGEKTALEQALQINPSMSIAQYQLGYLVYSSGDYESAAQHFQQAVTDDPDFTQAWISLAATLAAKSQFAEAQDAISHALRIEPQNREALALKKQLTVARVSQQQGTPR